MDTVSNSPLVRKRLIAVQGPTQLINALAILIYQKKFESPENYEDHLLLGGMSVQNIDLNDLSSTCRNIAAFWNFHSITNIDESILWKGTNDSFYAGVTHLRDVVGISSFDCVYVCRNWQLFNELVLNAYPNGTNFCYGDGFGTIDLKNETDTGAYCTTGYRKIHQAYLFCPIQEDPDHNSFNLVSRLIRPPHQILVDTIRQIAESLPIFRTHCMELAAKHPTTSTLILTSNYTEASFFRCSRFRLVLMLWLRRLLALLTKNRLNLQVNKNTGKEITMYLEQIRRYDLGSRSVYIKGHPRQTLSQSDHLADKLREEGYEVVEISNFRNYPIEFYACFLNFQNVIALGSSSATSLKILNPMANIKPLIDDDIRKRYFFDNKLKLTGPDYSYYYHLDSTADEKLSPL